MCNFVIHNPKVFVMINIYKIGGNVINDPLELRNFIKDFSSIPGKKILVHGGGKEATELGKQVGLEAKMINGRRVTDRDTLDLVTMVYAGLTNKRIVALLQEYGCNATGLSGADGNVIPAKKRSPVPIDYGFVGDIDPAMINLDFISLLINNGYTPVFCAICRDREGGLLNCNADSIASALAKACAKIDETRLHFCFEKTGVLKDLDNPDSLISSITPKMFDSLVESGAISGGMIPKVFNALEALKAGVTSVRICDSKNVTNEIGTLICND